MRAASDKTAALEEELERRQREQRSLEDAPQEACCGLEGQGT